MQKNSTMGLALGSGLIFSSNVYLAYLIFVFSLSAFSRKRAKINPSYFQSAAGLLLAFALSFGGVTIGNDEAVQYAFRILACMFAGIAIFSIARRGDVSFLQNFLFGMVFAATVNGIVTIVTALVPDVYGILKISQFSGFDKNMRFLRSPGLFRGYDTSGYFMIIALSAVPMIKTLERKFLLRLGIFFILLLGVALSSRSSILMLGIALILVSLFYREVVSWRIRVVTGMLASAVIFLGWSFSVSLFGGSTSPFLERILFPLGVGFDQIYSMQSDTYLDHFNLEGVGFFPRVSSFTPDNFFVRSLYALGVVGTAGILLHALHLAFSSVLNHKGNLRRFALVFVFILFFANFKNNYFLFLPYYTILSVIYATRPARSKVGYYVFE